MNYVCLPDNVTLATQVWLQQFWLACENGLKAFVRRWERGGVIVFECVGSSSQKRRWSKGSSRYQSAQVKADGWKQSGEQTLLVLMIHWIPHFRTPDKHNFFEVTKRCAWVSWRAVWIVLAIPKMWFCVGRLAFPEEYIQGVLPCVFVLSWIWWRRTGHSQFTHHHMKWAHLTYWFSKAAFHNMIPGNMTAVGWFDRGNKLYRSKSTSWQQSARLYFFNQG